MQHHHPSSNWHEPTPPQTPGPSTQASASASSPPRKFLHYYFDRRCREHATYDCPTCIADHGDQQPSNTFLHRSSTTNGNAPVINPPSSSPWAIAVPPSHTHPGLHRNHQHIPAHLPLLAEDNASPIASAGHPRVGSLTAANRWRHNHPIRSSTAEEIAARDKLEADQKKLDDEKARLESEQQQRRDDEAAAKAEAEQKKHDADAAAAAADATKQAEEAEAERKSRAAAAETAASQQKLTKLTEQVALLQQQQQQQQQEQRQREEQLQREAQQQQQQPSSQRPENDAPASSSPFPPPLLPRSSSPRERKPSRLQRIRQKAADLVRGGGGHRPVSS